jgi:hypothetical protein
MTRLAGAFARTASTFFLLTGAGTALIGLYAVAPAWAIQASIPSRTLKKGPPLRPWFVKRRSSLVVGSAEACSRDTLHEERFTDDENAADGLFPHPANTGGGCANDEIIEVAEGSHGRFLGREQHDRPGGQ